MPAGNYNMENKKMNTGHIIKNFILSVLCISFLFSLFGSIPHFSSMKLNSPIIDHHLSPVKPDSIIMDHPLNLTRLSLMDKILFANYTVFLLFLIILLITSAVSIFIIIIHKIVKRYIFSFWILVVIYYVFANNSVLPHIPILRNMPAVPLYFFVVNHDFSNVPSGTWN